MRAAHDRGAYVFAHCTAAFVLGEAGLLDDRRCTTHWRHVEELADAFPAAKVDADVLYVQDGTIVTGAGSAAGLDAALHLMRQQFGARVAAAAARRMVVPPHRDGGQAQFIARAVPDCDAETLGPVLSWIVENLGEDLSVDRLSRQHHMSSRTFARRFRDGDRHHPAPVGDPAAGPGGRGAARAHRPPGRVDRGRGGLRQRRRPAPPLHPGARASSPQQYRRQFAC